MHALLCARCVLLVTNNNRRMCDGNRNVRRAAAVGSCVWACVRAQSVNVMRSLACCEQNRRRRRLV